MKRLLVSILFLIGFRSASGQDVRSMTRYDDEAIRTISIPDLFTNLEDALNIVSFKGAEPLDFKIIKNRLFNDTEMPRTFFGERIIVENDLHFDDWTNSLKSDLEAAQYIENFNLMYPKTQDPSVTLKITGISKLKKKDYYYYNVTFESAFKNKDIYGNRFVPVRRLAEVRVEFDSTWIPYINVIRFEPKGFSLTDNTNDFTGFSEIEGQSTDAKLKLISRKESDEKQVAARLEALIDQGDSLSEKDQFDVALKYFQRARLLDPDNAIVNAKLHACDSIVEARNSSRMIMDERNVRVARLRSIALKSYHDHYLEISKSAIDSLIVNYEVDDPEIKTISSRLSKVVPFISQMNIIEQGKDYELGLDYSTRIVRSSEKNPQEVDSLLASEALYWSGRMFYNLDSLRSEDAAAYFKEALLYSSNTHLPARILLVKTRLYRKKNKLEALEMATSMVDAEPRNPDLRALRAYVYEYLQDNENALKEYQLAIQLKTAYPAVYAGKARLEMQLGRNSAAAMTAASGLTVFPCDLELSYVRISALEQAGLFKDAGRAFEDAESCGLQGAERDQLLGRSMALYKKATGFLEDGKTDSAIFYYSRSFDLTQSKEALFQRGNIYYETGSLEKALDDLNRLIQTDSAFDKAYYLRGKIKSAFGNHESAINDYKKQLEITPGFWEGYVAFGRSESSLGEYQMAAAYFERSNQIELKDSVAALAVEAYYRAGLYNKGLEHAGDYRSKSKSENAKLMKFQGLCEFYLSQYKDAESDLTDCMKMFPQDYEAAYHLSKTLMSRSEPQKSNRLADKAVLACNECPEAVVWKSVTTFALLKEAPQDIRPEQMESALRKDTLLKSSENMAWLAYGLLISGKDASQYSPWLSAAKETGPDDPVVLFVQASILAGSSADAGLVTNLLSRACVNGFKYPSFLDSDPGLVKYKSDSEFKAIRQKYFRN